MTAVKTVLAAVIVLSSVATCRVCNYSLEFSVCVNHLAVNQTGGGAACDRLRTELTVVNRVEDSVRATLQQSFWNDVPVQEFTFEARRSSGGQLQYLGDLSGIEIDLARGVGRVLLEGGEGGPRSPSCSYKEVVRDESRRVHRTRCRDLSQTDSIFYIEDFIAETNVEREGSFVKNVKIDEVFTRSANAHEKIGEEVRTRLELTQRSCVDDGDEVGDQLPGVDLQPRQDQPAEVQEVEKILREPNVLVLMEKLVRVLRPLSTEEIGKLLKKYRTSEKLMLMVEACGGSGSLAAYTAVLSFYPPSSANTDGLEKFLLALSFAANPDERILQDLQNVLKKYKKSPTVVETAFYCLCKHTGRQNKNKESLEKLFTPVGGLSCSNSDCQRMVLGCITALQSDEFTDQILKLSKSAKDKKIRELAASVLRRPGTVSQRSKSAIQSAAWQLLHTESASNEEFAKMLDLVDLKSAKYSQLSKILKSKNKERLAYFVQKLVSERRTSAVDYSLLSYTGQGESVYIHNGLQLGAGDELNPADGRFTFATTSSGGTLRRTLFSLDLVDTTNHARDLLSIQSYLGGFSGFLGTADPDDDSDMNAVVQISLLGLPMRPLVLFSSMNDLIDLYFSGAGQEKTTLLQGVIPLEVTDKEWETSVGIKVKIQSQLSLHIHSTGQGSISIFESSGSGNLQTSVEVGGASRVQVEAPEAAFVSTKLNLKTGVKTDSTVQLGSKLNACVIMSSDNISLNLDLESRKWRTSKQLIVPGLTWNLNKKNNEVCSMFSKTG